MKGGECCYSRILKGVHLEIHLQCLPLEELSLVKTINVMPEDTK